SRPLRPRKPSEAGLYWLGRPGTGYAPPRFKPFCKGETFCHLPSLSRTPLSSPATLLLAASAPVPSPSSAPPSVVGVANHSPNGFWTPVVLRASTVGKPGSTLIAVVEAVAAVGRLPAFPTW